MDRVKLKNRAKDFLSGGRYLKSLVYTLFVTLLSTNFLLYNAETDKYYIGLSLIAPIREISQVTFRRLGFLFIMVVLFIIPMFRVSLSKYFLRDYEDMEKFNEEKLLSLGSENYGNIIKVFLLRGLKLSLWFLLLIIPGIIKSYEYFMLPYIMAEDPGIDSGKAFKISKYMMDGNKMNILILDLSFFLWRFIGLLIPGAIFLIRPYIEATFAQAYLDIKEKKEVAI